MVLAVSQSKMEVEIGISLIIPTITALPTLVGLTLPASAAAATAAVTAAVARCAATACAAAAVLPLSMPPPLRCRRCMELAGGVREHLHKGKEGVIPTRIDKSTILLKEEC